MSHELISADSHVNPPATMWAKYLPESLREKAPRIESTDEGDFQVFEGRRTPLLGINAMAGKKPEEFSWNVRRLNEQRAGGFEPNARLEDMDADHVQAEVIYGGGPLPSQDAELRHASYQVYNDWLADFCSADPKRLIGIAYLPCDTPEMAIAEVKRAAGRGLKGGVIPRFPGDDEWYEPKWDGLWRAILDQGWAAAVHVGGRHRKAAMPSTDSVGFISDLLMSKFAMAESVSRMVLSGLLERYPDLQVVSVEGQLGWLSFTQHYLDHVWEKHRHWTKNELKNPPSFYFKRQVHATFMEDPVGLREREHIGIDNIMWSSDYPHSETTWPDSRKLTNEWMSGFPEAERRKILYENAARLYRL
ncbi:MAG: amidohydrolase family protein [Candidatus Binatia bacterium]|nr:amidohydrolase family protein [Candidatus Binatia bacterium]